jgi:phospholipid/cholesterol/gamma-HCH transport system ATP-binding protein
MSIAPAIIELQNLSMYYGRHCVFKDVALSIYKGEALAIVGGSGSGKTTLLRNILMLQAPTRGSVNILGTDITQAPIEEITRTRRNIGVMFQRGALFSSLTIQENIAFPLRLYTDLSPATIQQIALLKISLVGLPQSAAYLYPAELSGGMIKRAAVARAIAMDPDILFLDEPTAGLDPKGASDLDSLVLDLKASLGLTIVLVTHDLDTLWRVADRVAFLGEHKILMTGSMSELTQAEHPLIRDYFSGPRGRVAQQQAEWNQ